MRVGIVIVALVAVLPAGAAVAIPAIDPPSASDAVTSYPASFFDSIRPNTARDMVVALPGFALDGGGGARGFGAAGNVLIDGERPATKNDSLDEILNRIPATSVARIDLIRGGAPGIDMQGRTVIANVIRKSDNGLKLTTAIQGASLYNGKWDYGLRIEGTKRSGDTSFEGGMLLATGADDGTGGGPRTITNAAGVVTQHGLEHYFGDQGTDKFTAAVETPVLGGKLRVEGSYLRTPYFSLKDDALVTPPDNQVEVYRQDQDAGEIGLRYDRQMGARSSLEVYALQQLNRYALADDFWSTGDASTFTLGKRGGESILRGTWKFAARPDLSLEAGAEGDYNWQTSRTAETDQGAALFVPAANVLVREKRGEAFADATWRPKPTLTLELGARLEASQITSTGDVVSSDTYVFPKPRGVATWAPDANDQLQLRVEREVSQLDFADFAASGSLGSGVHAGNPQLTPPQDWVIEATYDRKFWGGGDISVAARRYWLTDAIDRAPFCGDAPVPGAPLTCNPADEFDAPANIGSGWREELTAALTLPTDKLGLKDGQFILRSTWRRSQVTDPSTHLPREISGLHPVDAEAHFTQALPKWNSRWGLDVYSAWRQTLYYFSEVDVQRLGYWADAYFEYKPRPDLGVKFEADNIATHGLEYIRQFYAPFRDVGGGELASVDNRSPRFGPEFSVRVRKTWG
ncbi:MAG TPA: TonB-dependent receptor [Caulobacteraceae bacterium]